MIDDSGMALITQTIKDEQRKIRDIIAAQMDVQAGLLGVLVGALIDSDLVSRAELNSRIETVSRGRPEYQQQLLAIVQKAISAQH